MRCQKGHFTQSDGTGKILRKVCEENYTDILLQSKTVVKAIEKFPLLRTMSTGVPVPFQSRVTDDSKTEKRPFY